MTFFFVLLNNMSNFMGTAADPVNVNGKLLTTTGFHDKEAETGGK